MIVAVSAQPEHIAEDPIVGEALDSTTLEQLREQISYSLAIATQEDDELEHHEFHIIISQSSGHHDWTLFGTGFTDPGSSDLYAGDEPTHDTAFAAAIHQAILSVGK
jgi:hypothetical protein